MNAKPILFFDTVYTRGVVSATDTAADFDVDNIFDYRTYKFWKAASAGTKYLTVDLNEVTNSGAESNNFTGLTQNDAVIEGGSPLSGSFSFKIVASGSDEDGAEFDKVTVDPLKTYRLKAKNSVSGYSGGNYKLQIHFYDAEDNLISSTTIQTWTGNTGGTVVNSKSVGPAGSDLVIPAGTASISVQDIADGTATLTGLMDDVLFYEEIDPDGLGIIGHNFYTARAGIKVESSNDATEAISSWTERLASFNASNDDAFFKAVTAVGAQRAWRIELITPDIAPFVAVLLLGERLTMERYIMNDYDPAPEAPEAETTRNQIGNHLGTTISNVERSLIAEFQGVTDAWYLATFKPAWDVHIGLHKPYLWIWDLTNHPAEVFYVKIPDSYRLRAPFTPVRRTLVLNHEGIKE